MKKAFTLAEVLITLVIIGVIAAFTIPAIINAQNDKETLARLKKSYSTLSQVMMTSQALNGSFTDWGMRDNDTSSIEQTFNYYILPYIKNLKKCVNTAGCWTSQKTKAFDGNGYASTSYDTGMGQNNITFILNDGTFVSMDIYGNDVDEVFGITEDVAFPTLTFAVDINGDKAPNQVGKDVFFFVLTKHGLAPAGKDNSAARCYAGATGGYSGYDCAAKVLKTGSVQY